MKIGLVFDDSLDRPDGVQQYLLALGRWLSGQGHEVHYLVGETTRDDIPHIHSLSRNLTVRFNGNRLSIPRPADRRRIAALLSDEKFDVLHVMMPYSPFLAGRIIGLAEKYSVDTVIAGTFHILPQTGLVRRSTRLLGLWLRRSLRRFDAVFAVSPAAADFAAQAFRLRDVEVLPNVIDTNRFQGARPFERYDDDVPTIMFLGRLVPRKGCVTLLEAVAELRKTYDGPLRLVICGTGEEEAALRRRADGLGIADITEFTGFISEADKPRYLASADILVFPSTGGESFGIVLIEAMAVAGTDGTTGPMVLAAANPGYASVMEPRPEQLFAPGAALQLSQKLNRYLRDPAVSQAAVEWQAHYVSRFDTAAVGRRLLETYTALTAQLRNKR